MIDRKVGPTAGWCFSTDCHERDADGHCLVVRNAHTPEREVQTELGTIFVKQPHVNDRRVDAEGNCIRFTSKILSPYLPKTINSCIAKETPTAREALVFQSPSELGYSIDCAMINKSIEELILWLYLCEISTGDFNQGLSSLLG